MTEADLARVSDPGMRMLASLGWLHRMPPQTVFVNEGEIADTAFVILSGRVKVFASDPEGREIVLNICGAGDCIGDMALDGGPRSASVVTLDRVTCAVVARDALHKAVATNPDFAMRLITTLIQRNRIATSKIKGLALQGVRERVLDLLEGLAVERDGAWLVGERLSQQEIAHRVGASRDMVRRVFQELEDDGAIRMDRRQVTLLHAPPPR
ncbi:MAG TPA: Crp/Fnr family transcriptional regulator [Ramlibacter sp.]|jgi:CRP/FNR family cyclic AMP-dependent transcriptional regulator